MDTVILVKVLTALAYPLGLVALFSLLWLLLKLLGAKWLSRVSLILAVSILTLASNPQVAGYLASDLEQRYPQPALTDLLKHDAIIVLGGGLRLPTSPARHTQIGRGSDRLWYAVRLYRAGLADKIMLSGGNAYPQPGFNGESEYAAELLQEWGVPRASILVESLSRTTLENKENAALFLSNHNIKTALLVTSALHMPRAYALFSELPIPVTPASADVLVRDESRPQILGWIPSAAALHLSTVAVHEHYGLLVNNWLYSSR